MTNERWLSESLSDVPRVIHTIALPNNKALAVRSNEGIFMPVNSFL